MSLIYKVLNCKLNNFIVRLYTRFTIGKDAKFTQDSREVKNGDCYICIKGSSFDGHSFVNSVINNGARVVIVTDINSYLEIKNQNTNTKTKIFYYNISNINQMVKLLNTKYKKKPKICAITGTNGKTSTVHFCVEILRLCNIKSASVGTLGVKTNFDHNITFPQTNLTTPDIVSLYNIFADLYKLGVKICFVEASSIALVTNRLAGIKVAVAGFTNFTQDHLDYHKTMQSYFDSKMLLFKQYLKRGLCFKPTAVINGDIEQMNDVVKNIDSKNCNILFFSSSFTSGSESSLSEQTFSFSQNNDIINIKAFGKNFVRVVGSYANFQAYNICLAFACVYCFYNNIQQKLGSSITLPQPEGRMQSIKNSINAKIFVDFAHTPDALEKVLQQCKKMNGNKLICLFGCGGDRDTTKRPIMAKIAAKLCDFVIITSDNPRSEDINKINSDTIKGFEEVCYKNFIIIIDRAEAIKYAISTLNKDDILVLAGKGAEDYQIIGITKHHFNDKEEVEKALNNFIATNK